MPAVSSVMRNTYIYPSGDRDTLVGGLWVTPGVTKANLHSMLEIICCFTDTFELRNENGHLVENDEGQLQPDNYYIVTNGSITLTAEVPLPRTISVSSETRTAAFSKEVRERDGGCVLTGRPAIFGRWIAFEATHIFPMAYEGYWNDNNYDRWITIPPANRSHGLINSVQNGIVLSLDMQSYFESYLVTINPDDNYKIVCFGPEVLQDNIPERVNSQFLQNPLRPVDELLRWHFRQAVLTNVKGAGEPFLDADFPPGCDMIGEILGSPKAAKRMEFELFNRFNAMAAPS